MCGMDLVPMKPTESEDNKTYLDLLRNENSHLYIAYFIIAMSDMIPLQPLMQVMDSLQWNWVQFGNYTSSFYAAWILYELEIYY
jgi:Cu2+-exporting ATPase